MAALKTTTTDASVDAFIDAIDDERVRTDCRTLLAMMTETTGETPTMWGNGTVGFGTYRYTYPTGQSGEWYTTGFAPRKANLTIYIMTGFPQHDDLMARLGKHKTGKSCLYVKCLDDIDMDILRQLVERSYAYMRETYPAS